jgi:LAS superfamily LD-carboxypeptidase LdcB
MLKKILIAVFILILIIAAISMLWQTNEFSSTYNYATAKLDIKDGNARIIHLGLPKISSKDNEIEMVAARYGFKNIYIEKFTKNQTENGVKNYNELIETYLKFRNGPDWKTRYEKEVDSLYKVAFNQDNDKN